jgi:2-hydroxyglutarate dehydrogenase
MKSSRALFRATTGTLRNSVQRHQYRHPDFEVDHLVVGGGVIGLACAAKLTTAMPDKTTYLVERHDKVCIFRFRGGPAILH